jgi:predicted phage terminase large subunit-like protein
MAIKPIQWDELSYSEQLALAAAGEQSPLAFTALWFNITQGDSFRTNWHHHYFNWAAEKVLSGEVKNLIVNIPPGGTKTEFWSVHLPVYCMVKFPRVRILNTSYSKDLVSENSERSRALVKSSEFQQFYSFDIGKDKVDDWTIEKDGKRIHQLFSRPSGGQITGVRGGYMSDSFSGYINADDWDKIDDLFSETKRKKSHTRIVNTLRSRKADFNTPFIFVQQRGHVDDSTAYLLSGSMGLEIDLHIKIPALIDQDYIDSLPPGIKERCIQDVCSHKQLNGKWSYWPAKESVEDLTALKTANPYTFASQYDQDPEKLDGGIFFESDFEYYGSVEDGADIPQPDSWEYRIITVDTAQKTGEANDWTVYTEWGVYQGCIYRLRSFRKRVTAKELRQAFKSFVQACWEDNRPSNGNLRAILVEDKSSGTGLIQEMTNQLPLRITPLPRAKDKLTRAMDCQPHVGSKKVKLRYGDPTNLDFVPEVCSFKEDDSHPFDDQTDTMMDAVDYVCIQPFTTPKAFVMKRSR